MDLSSYIGKIASLKEEFMSLVPTSMDGKDQQNHIGKLFLDLTLFILRPDIDPVRDQIVASSYVPSLDEIFARLFRISSTQTTTDEGSFESSILASRAVTRSGRDGGGRGRNGWGRHPDLQCMYYNRIGHTYETDAFQLHGRPLHAANIVDSYAAPNTSEGSSY